MMTVSQLRSTCLQTAGLFLLLTTMTSCELPPREAWRIIQRDGLITYWSREYQPNTLPSRYLAPAGSPLVATQRSRAYHGPYRPGDLERHYTPENRYLAKNKPSSARVPYRSPAKSYTRHRSQAQASRTPREKPEESKILVEPSRPSASTPARTAASGTTKQGETPKPSMESLPYGTPVPGRPGMVTSPFAEKQQLVDVTGMSAGDPVKDPYSGKLFRVPPTPFAAAEKTETTPPPAPATTPSTEDSKPKP